MKTSCDQKALFEDSRTTGKWFREKFSVWQRMIRCWRNLRGRGSASYESRTASKFSYEPQVPMARTTSTMVSSWSCFCSKLLSGWYPARWFSTSKNTSMNSLTSSYHSSRGGQGRVDLGLVSLFESADLVQHAQLRHRFRQAFFHQHTDE